MRAAIVSLLIAAAATGCGGDTNAALAQLTEARSRSEDLQVQFVKASDAANRAVMADTDESSVAFAKEADQAKQAVQADIDALTTLLQGPHYADEAQLLRQFVTQFDEYRTLDAQVLTLAVENTNLKAQRLSFDAAQNAADDFRAALEAVIPADSNRNAWQIKALVASAVSAVREIQVLQAPHIATPDDAAMTRLESRMAAAQTVARNDLGGLASIAAPASRRRLAAATAALDRFVAVNTEIIGLSRRNTNVRSLALSLDQKRKLIAPCEATASALHDALAKRGYPAGR